MCMSSMIVKYCFLTCCMMCDFQTERKVILCSICSVTVSQLHVPGKVSYLLFEIKVINHGAVTGKIPRLTQHGCHDELPTNVLTLLGNCRQI